MMQKSSKRKIFLTITAVLCIVVFAVLLSIARDPSLLKGNNGNAAVFEYGDDFIKFIDVGQGDSALIYSNGYSAVIDMGISPAADDIIDDAALYFLFVKLAARAKQMENAVAWESALATLLADYQEPVPGARERIEKTLRIMGTAWIAARTRQAAEKLIEEL